MSSLLRFGCFFLLVVTLLCSAAYAVVESRPLSSDRRFHVITYRVNEVFKYVGHYEYQSSIVFEQGETIKTISMGNTEGWQMIPSGNRMFIKPVGDGADTNMTLITDKRIYYFELYAEDIDEDLGMQDENFVFVMRFVYPDADTVEGSVVQRLDSGTASVDLSEPEKYNFNYTIAGSDFISPIRIFDDGEFTYFQFSEKNAEIPAFFIVDAEGGEGLVNFRVDSDYIVVERVASQFTLRHGPDVLCVFNEAMPLRKKNIF